jgi:hypothetical protein
MNKKNKFIKKINVVDILIVSIIIIFVFGGMVRLNKLDQMTVDKTDPLEMTILFEDVSEGFKENVLVGDILKDSVRGYSIGEIANVKIDEHREMISTNHKIIYTVIPNKWDITVEVKGNGLFDGNGVLIGSRRYFIGTDTRIKSDKYVSNIEVIDLKKSEE